MTLRIDGIVETTKSLDQWMDDFIDWLESRDEMFGGLTETLCPKCCERREEDETGREWCGCIQEP